MNELEEELLDDLFTTKKDYKHKVNLISMAFIRYYHVRKRREDSKRDLEQQAQIAHLQIKAKLKNNFS